MTEFTHPGEPIDVDAGEEFGLRLRSTPTTGYRWVIAEPHPPPDIVLVVDESFEAPGSDRPGAAGAQVFRLRAVGPGSTTVALRHARPWDDVSKSDAETLFTVRVR